jgi:hypothetical protein
MASTTIGGFVGTTDGVYYRDDSLNPFKPFKHGLPSVVVRSLLLDQARQRLFAGTHARGIWQTPMLPNCRPLLTQAANDCQTAVLKGFSPLR